MKAQIEPATANDHREVCALLELCLDAFHSLLELGGRWQLASKFLQVEVKEVPCRT